MSPPKMAAWNLGLRFGIEIAALVALAVGAWAATPSPARWGAVVVVPAIAIAAWGVFNVVDDPSRSGQAPVEVPGWLRLSIELAVLVGGAVALVVAGWPYLGLALALLILVHYAASLSRIRWMLRVSRR